MFKWNSHTPTFAMYYNSFDNSFSFCQTRDVGFIFFRDVKYLVTQLNLAPSVSCVRNELFPAM